MEESESLLFMRYVPFMLCGLTVSGAAMVGLDWIGLDWIGPVFYSAEDSYIGAG